MFGGLGIALIRHECGFTYRLCVGIDTAQMALQQHLADSCCAAEVAIYLEWRMEVEQVRVGPLRGQEAIDLVRLVAIVQPRPETGFPARAPAGRFIPPVLHGHQRGLVKFLRRQRRNIAARMQGNQVFRHAVAKLASTAGTAMEKAGVTTDDIDWIVPHQANIRIIQGTAKKMGVSMDKVVVTVQDHGNTSAASIPLALSVGKSRGQIKQGDLVVTEAIGGGLAWGAVVLRW